MSALMVPPLGAWEFGAWSASRPGRKIVDDGLLRGKIEPGIESVFPVASLEERLGCRSQRRPPGGSQQLSARQDRPVHGGDAEATGGSLSRRWILFSAWYDGDDRVGLGVRPVWGRTGLIARIMHVFAGVAPGQFLERGEAVDLAPGGTGRTKDGATFAGAALRNRW
jgi:hypothetical protein